MRRCSTAVDELAAGDLIPSADGTLLTVVSTLWTGRIETVYNFGVEGFHTYFVGDVGVWVHNCTRLSPYEINKMKAVGLDPETLKREVVGHNARLGQFDLFKDAQGNIVVRRKGSDGAGEPTGVHIDDLE